MPKFSMFTPFGMLKFSGAPSRGERFYRAMYSMKVGAIDLTKGGYNEAKVYGQSMGIARGRYALERAFNQRFPMKSIECLPLLEANWAVIPSETDTLLDRQLNVLARMMLVRGAQREAIEEGLRAILGSHFIALRTLLPGEVTNDAPVGDFGPNFSRPDLPFKLIQLSSAVSILNTPINVAYRNGDPTAGQILVQKNDIFMFQPESVGLAEIVTIQSATATDLTATFKHSHDVDSYATTQNWVNWTSTQRSYLIVVDATAALDTEMVRRVNDFMSKVSRGVSIWDIVEPTTVGASTIGPFTLDLSPLGAVPIGTMSIFPPVPPDFALLPARMPTSGGLFRIMGRHLGPATDVQINAISVPFVVISDFEIQVTLPPTFMPSIVFGFDPASVFLPCQVLTPTGNVSQTIEIYPAPVTVTSIVPGIQPGPSDVYGTGLFQVNDIKANSFSFAPGWTIVDDTHITGVVSTNFYGTPGHHAMEFYDINGVIIANPDFIYL